MAGKYSITIEDHSEEKSTLQVTTPQASAANFDGIVADCDAFEQAVRAMSIGAFIRDHLTAQSEEFGEATPANPYAQRELYWSVTTDDGAGNVSGFTIPCADLTDPTVLLGNTEKANLAHATWVALAAAYDGNFIHPSSGNPLTINGATLEGRS